MTHWARKVAESFEPVDQTDDIVLLGMIREARQRAGCPARPPWRPIGELIAEAQARSDAEYRRIRAGE